MLSIVMEKIACGYPTYYQEGNTTYVSPGIVFRKINGYPIPAKIGVKDFFLQGTFSNIIKYLKERSEYQIIAQTLENDGKWKDNGSSTVHVTIANQAENAYALLVNHIRDKVIKVVTGVGIHKVLAEKLSIISNEFGLKIDKDELEKIIKALEKKNKSEAIFNITHYFTKKVPHHQTGGKSVSKSDPLSITITAYPPPKTNARAVCDLKKSTVYVKDIEKAIESFLNGQGC